MPIFAKKIGLNTNTTKSQVIGINVRSGEPIILNGISLEDVEKFIYFGSLLSKDNAAAKDIKPRLGKACSAFARPQPIWKSAQFSLSNVKCVLLYGSECWSVIKSGMKKIEVFHNNCLRRICNIFWPERISNAELYKKTNSHRVW